MSDQNPFGLLRVNPIQLLRSHIGLRAFRSVEQYRDSTITLAKQLEGARYFGLAEKLLKQVDAAAPDDLLVKQAIVECFKASGKRERLQESRLGYLRTRVAEAVANKDLKMLLDTMAVLESQRKSAGIQAGRYVGQLLMTTNGHTELGSAAAKVLQKYPDSILLIYLRSVTLAKKGEMQQAHDFVDAAILKHRLAEDGFPGGASAHQARMTQLTKIWRVVDAITRDSMEWTIGNQAGDSSAGSGDDRGGDDGAPVEEQEPAAGKDAFVLDEQLIQGRQIDRYLAACRQAFENAKTPQDEFKAVDDMLRVGLRRMPTYHESYAIARTYYERLRRHWQPRAAQSEQEAKSANARTATTTFRILRAALQLARKLGYREDAKILELALVRLAQHKSYDSFVWSIAAELVADDVDRYLEESKKIVRRLKRLPEREHEVRAFFNWAARARQHKAAQEVFDRLPEHLKRSTAVTNYVKICQRAGNFAQAGQIVGDINAQMLASPHAMDPFTSWRLILRRGELKFAVETAKWYRLVPQPRRPEGVVLISPRSFDQLRRYPLVVLMELKRMGWAVVPLVEGMLPRELTGDPEIDQFNGCLSGDQQVVRGADQAFEPVSRFVANVSRGELSWDGIDLSHPLWEEATINRRRFSVDFSCPALSAYLQRLADWTRLHAIILQNAHRVMTRKKLRTGVMILGQYRLPDALSRHFCAKLGNPQTFFCIHSTNGYENYFANFTSPVSTKTAIRNVTAVPHVRTASFPVPSEFETWYQRNRLIAPQMLAKVQDITKIRRSASTGSSEMPMEAQAIFASIEDWRARGGKVACAFGKIVCDLAVPQDGGPAHRNMKDWLNHTVEAVRDSNTLLLVKPHPHELRNDVATFLTEYFADLVDAELPSNVFVLGHQWFSIHDLSGRIDLGLLYNGTTAVELGLLGIPAVLCSNYGAIDYPVGHVRPRDRDHYERLVRFEEEAAVPTDLKERSAAWLHYLSGEDVSVPYRYHSRQITNRVVYPPWWFEEDITSYLAKGDRHVTRLAMRAVGEEGVSVVPPYLSTQQRLDGDDRTMPRPRLSVVR
jgi:hypothetical protein